MAAGANELAASKCEEALTCLDGWLAPRKAGYASPEPANPVDIPGRYHASYTLLAQCQMQMGHPKQAATTYTRLLGNPAIVMCPAQRDQIAHARDRLVRQLAAATQPANPSVGPSLPDNGLRPSSPAEFESSVARGSAPPVVRHAATDRRPKVTVITVCRNGAGYLRECVESILNQTLPDWELLLINDGSTDDTGRVIDDLTRRDARVKPFHFPDSRGPYVRRNSALRQAEAEFIVIQDADGIMSPAKLERLYREIAKNDRMAMVGSYYRIFLEEFRGLEHTEPCELPVDHDTIVASCVSWRAISHGMSIIRKALFDTIGPYDENPFAADAFWSAKLALYAEAGGAVKMANIPEHLTLVRVHSGSEAQLLPVFDPRGRRVRYRLYCECKLRRVREKWRQQPQLDLAAELRSCNCSDFLTRFKAQIIQWENETLAADFISDLLRGASSCFRQGAHASCVSILNGVEAMQRDIARRVRGFDLLRGLGYWASGLSEQGVSFVQREIENHDDPLAHQFLRDCHEQGPSMDVQNWYAEHAFGLALHPAGAERPRVRGALV